MIMTQAQVISKGYLRIFGVALRSDSNGPLDVSVFFMSLQVLHGGEKDLVQQENVTLATWDLSKN